MPKPYHTPKSERDEALGALEEAEGLDLAEAGFEHACGYCGGPGGALPGGGHSEHCLRYRKPRGKGRAIGAKKR